jgi:hypothetical protein
VPSRLSMPDCRRAYRAPFAAWPQKDRVSRLPRHPDRRRRMSQARRRAAAMAAIATAQQYRDSLWLVVIVFLPKQQLIVRYYWTGVAGNEACQGTLAKAFGSADSPPYSSLPGSVCHRIYCAINPPSMTNSAPVTNDVSSDARNNTP